MVRVQVVLQRHTDQYEGEGSITVVRVQDILQRHIGVDFCVSRTPGVELWDQKKWSGEGEGGREGGKGKVS